jgi:phenylalanyl-tRNA synthetase beta chain
VDDLKHKPLSWVKAEAAHSWQHPKNVNAIVCDGALLGHIGVAHPIVSKNIDKKAAIVFAEIDIDALANIGAERIKYVEPSRFPGMEQDLTFLAETYAPIKAAIEAANSPLVNKVAVVGTYTDEAGKSITVRISFSHAERTLTREEVQAVVDGIVADLESKDVALKK